MQAYSITGVPKLCNAVTLMWMASHCISADTRHVGPSIVQVNTLHASVQDYVEPCGCYNVA